MKGQNERPVRRPVFLLGLCLILILYVLWDKRHEIIPSQDRTPQIELKRDSVIQAFIIGYKKGANEAMYFYTKGGLNPNSEKKIFQALKKDSLNFAIILRNVW